MTLDLPHALQLGFATGVGMGLGAMCLYMAWYHLREFVHGLLGWDKDEGEKKE